MISVHQGYISNGCATRLLNLKKSKSLNLVIPNFPFVKVSNSLNVIYIFDLQKKKMRIYSVV